MPASFHRLIIAVVMANVFAHSAVAQRDRQDSTQDSSAQDSSAQDSSAQDSSAQDSSAQDSSAPIPKARVPQARVPQARVPQARIPNARVPNAEEVDRWANDLGHDQYLRREKASRKLIEIGAPAIEPLVAAMRSGDLEVIERAMDIITEIGLSQTPNEDGGAWDQLTLLASKGTGQTASRAELALAEIRSQRSSQARIALKAAGVFVGVDEFVVRSFNQHRLIIRIDDAWDGEIQSLQWLRWLYRIDNARVKGKAVSPAVLAQIVKVPDLKSIAIVDGVVDETTLEPLQHLQRIHSLEFRYVALKDEYGELLASLPLRGSLELMGTGISEEVVESMRQKLSGLQIIHRQGGFLGVQCLDTEDVCEISKVVVPSAAQKAGLQPGDIIVQIGDTKVSRFRDLQQEINNHMPGDDVEVKFQRGGKIKEVRLQLGKFEDT